MNRDDTAQTQPIFNSGYKLFMCFKGTKAQKYKQGIVK